MRIIARLSSTFAIQRKMIPLGIPIVMIPHSPKTVLIDLLEMLKFVTVHSAPIPLSHARIGAKDFKLLRKEFKLISPLFDAVLD